MIITVALEPLNATRYEFMRLRTCGMASRLILRTQEQRYVVDGINSRVMSYSRYRRSTNYHALKFKIITAHGTSRHVTS